MPPFLFCPGITPVSFGASGVAMETQETRGVSGTNGMLHEAKVDRRVSQNLSINVAQKKEEKKVRNSDPVFLAVALSHLPSSAPLSWKNAGVFILPWNNSVSSGASSVAMETQETQGVSETNGMLHEAKVDRHVPKTVHLNKVTPCFRKIMKGAEGLIPNIVEKCRKDRTAKDLFQFQLTPPGTEKERERKKSEIQPRYFSSSHPPIHHLQLR
ncbi:hypothetical protein CEXT_758831 [Caerostris extrusa]|uniref:Uncharacterized protein n=1 Tax=Caerostris extrusa TaxID=172846 RepID=A0AAV4X2P6_CAEEX|nr:hypothetical protein CEXT_758831 [Caerostris extrusa]